MYPSREREGLGVSSRYFLLLEIVEELHPVVGGQFPPARGLQYPDVAGLGRPADHLLPDLEHEISVPGHDRGGSEEPHTSPGLVEK